MIRRVCTLAIVALAVVSAIGAAICGAEKAATASPSARFEKEIAAFEAADLKSPPPEGAILFIGDSGIRMWKSLAQDFPDQKVINRGFGGSQMADSVYYADRIVIPYKPRLILIRSAGNDLTAGKTPEQIVADFKAFVEKVRAKLPDTRIVVLTGFASIATAVEAIKLGAAQYLAKPANTDDIEEAFAHDTGDPNAPLDGRKSSIKTLEWEYIHSTLAECDFNISAAARRLGMHRRTLARKLEKRQLR